MKKYFYSTLGLAVIGAVVLLTFKSANWSVKGLLVTSAQEYQYFFNKKEYSKAAGVVVDPMEKGCALFLAGEFAKAAAVFGMSSSKDAIYNRANSYLMLGKYDLAITDYEHVLIASPDWQEASENLELTRYRKEKMAPPEDDFGGTGGKLAADEIVIGDREIGSSGTEEDEDQTEEGSKLSKNEQQALWLKKVQTKPADFLRLKFSYQLTNKKR